MKNNEKTAFIEAYVNNVGHVEDIQVEYILSRIDSNESLNGVEGASSVLDSLGLWHNAIKFCITSKE